MIADEVPLPLAPVTPGAPTTMKKNVAAQLAWDSTDEHFPLLILGKEKYGDFTLKTKFKLVDGLTEQMAGIAFRIQDEKNFYVARASGLGKNFYFYKFDKGMRSPPIGNNMEIAKGVWHDLTIQCEGTDIHILLDGKEAMPTLHDPTFSSGKIGYLTKSDAISYFTDTRISYVSREPFAQELVRDTMKEYPRLLGVQVYTVPAHAKETQIIASSDEKEIGKAGGKNEADVIAERHAVLRQGEGDDFGDGAVAGPERRRGSGGAHQDEIVSRDRRKRMLLYGRRPLSRQCRIEW